MSNEKIFRWLACICIAYLGISNYYLKDRVSQMEGLTISTTNDINEMYMMMYDFTEQAPVEMQEMCKEIAKEEAEKTFAAMSVEDKSSISDKLGEKDE